MTRGDTFGDALRALRDGDIDFDMFTLAYRRRFYRLAHRLLSRWPPSHITEDDLIQDGLIECWQCLDYFDRNRGLTLEQYVTDRVCRVMRTTLAKTAGRPRADREPPMRPERMSHHAQVRHEELNGVEPIDRVEACEALSACPPGIERYAVAGVLLGMSARTVAAHLYADPDMRRRLRFYSPVSATLKVRCAIGRATRVFLNN